MKSNQTELLPRVQTFLLQNAGPSQDLDHPARPQTHLEHIEKLQTQRHQHSCYLNKRVTFISIVL